MSEHSNRVATFVAVAAVFLYATLGFWFTDARDSHRATVDKGQNTKQCKLIAGIVDIQALRTAAASENPIPPVGSSEPALQRTIDFLNKRALDTNTKALALAQSLHC